MLTNIKQPYVGSYIELFVFDFTSLGGGQLFLTNEEAEVIFRGQTYQFCPIEGSGYSIESTGATSRPTITVSNVERQLMPAYKSFGLVGAEVTRFRTFAEFLDNGDNPDENAIYPPDVFKINQVSKMDPSWVSLNMINEIDNPNADLPGWTVLKEDFPARGQTT
jgi:lambda family phage minor tail protein L